MFDSIATLFYTPTQHRHYELKPSLAQFMRIRKSANKKKQQTFIDKQTEDIIDNLHEPIETWIIQKQQHLQTHALNSYIYKQIAAHSRATKSNQDSNKVAKVTVHNLFVLIVQYHILNERIKQMGAYQLEIVVDGISGIFVKEEAGPMDQLTCLLHFIISNCKMHQLEWSKGAPSLFRPIRFQNLPNFFKVYQNLPNTSKGHFIDTVVNIIPLLAELLKTILKTDQSEYKHQILQLLPWIQSIGCRLLQLISRDIDYIIVHSSSIEQLSVQISDPESQNPFLFQRLRQKSKQLIEVEGFVSSKTLFNFAFKELYYFQHVLRLHRHMIQLCSHKGNLMVEQQHNNMKMIRLLLAAASNYDVNLTSQTLQIVTAILSSTLIQDHQVVHLYAPKIKSAQLLFYIKSVKNDFKYQWKQRSRWSKCQLQDDSEQFYLQKDQSLLSFILEMVQNLKLEYLDLLKLLIQRTNSGYLELLQFYLIKNRLLHFLIQQLQAVHSNDKKAMETYFQMLSLLLKGNTFAYCIFDHILQKQLQQNDKCPFVQHIRKHFCNAKPFLLTILADTITVNVKQNSQQYYFIPLPVQLLLYSIQKNDIQESRHDVWVSYIHQVIVRELRDRKDKQGKNDNCGQLNQWVCLVIMLQIECMEGKKGGELELGQFIMKYLTNILQQAIKWKHEDQTSVMRRLLTTYEEWQAHYTQTILDREDNLDVIEHKLGGVINFLFLRKWNRKICKAIRLFIQSVESVELTNQLF